MGLVGGIANPILFLTNTGNHDTSSMIAFFVLGRSDGEIVSFFPSRRRFPAQGTGLASSSTWAEPTRPRGRPARRLGLRLPAGEYRPAPQRARDRVPSETLKVCTIWERSSCASNRSSPCLSPRRTPTPLRVCGTSLHVRGNRLTTSASAPSKHGSLVVHDPVFPFSGTTD